MKTIILAIHKRHDLNIQTLLKTKEIRKRLPKPPFKVLNYQTLGSGGCGKVTCEWICDRVDKILYPIERNNYEIQKGSQITREEMLKYSDYGKKQTLAANVTAVKVYDEPRELNSYNRRAIFKGEDWGLCIVQHAPQNYLFVEGEL